MEKIEKNTSIGLVGCGRWGKFILRDLVKFGAEVHVVANGENSVSNARHFGASSCVPSIKDLPSDIQGFIVATPTSTHFEVVKSLLHFNKPIFVEKPFSPSSKEAEEILQLSSEIFVMHKWRYHSGIEKMKELVHSKDLGDVLNIKATRNQWGSPHKDVNSVWIHLPHDLSIIWHLLGRIPPLTHSTLIRDKANRVMGALAVFEDDAHCIIEHNACVVEKSRSVCVHFENGAIELVDPLSDHLLLRRGQPDERLEIQKIAIDTQFPLEKELKCFLDYSAGNQKHPYTKLSEELELIKTIEKVLEKE